MAHGRNGPFACMKKSSTLTSIERGDVRTCHKQLTQHHVPFAHPLHSQVYAAVMYVLLSAWTFVAVFVTVRSSGHVPPAQAANALGNSSSNNDNNTRRPKKKKRNQTVPVDGTATELNDLDGILVESPGDDEMGERHFSRVGIRHLSSRSGQSTKTLRKLAGIHHRLNTAGYVLYAVTCKMAITFLHCPAADAEADCHTEAGRPPALLAVYWGLVAFHLIFFPVAAFLAAARVHRHRMGGSCCSDSPATVQSQLCNHKTDVEVALWRYVSRFGLNN